MPVVTLVRHGETKLNRAQIVQSRTHGELTKKGIQMAVTLGQHLQNEKFTNVYTSDLKRCHDTTLNILKHSNHSQPEPELKELLRERDFGHLEFKSADAVTELMNKHSLPYYMIPIPGGEEYSDVMKRGAQFFEEICHLVDNSEIPDSEMNILVITHGAWIQTFLDYLAGNPDNYELHNYNHEKAKVARLHNTGNTKFHIEKIATVDNNNRSVKRSIKFYHFHCIKHLDDFKHDENDE